MTGGTIVGILTGPTTTRLFCEEFHGDRAGIIVKNETEMPQVGDSLWWQSVRALWTPKDARFEDRIMRKVGDSFRVMMKEDIHA